VITFEALARAARSLAQGAVAAGAVAAWQAGQAALQGGGFQPRIVVVAVVTAFVTAAASYGFTVVAPYLGATGPGLEALVRAGRTLLAGAVSAGLLAGWEAIYSAAQSGSFSPWILGTAGATAAVTAAVAFVHNMVKPRPVAT
jgi:hypothetical protein